MDLDAETLQTNSSDSSETRDPEKKRIDYLDWDEYFMATALLAAKRSKDPCTQVGACIVDQDKKIVAVGYNGMPNGCSDDKFPWGKRSGNELEKKFPYVCHAEMNAVLNKNLANLKGSTIYVGLFPCNECAKIIIQSGIKFVVYASDKNSEKDKSKATKKMFDAGGVYYRKFNPETNTEIVIVLRKKDSKKTQQPTPVEPSSTD